MGKRSHDRSNDGDTRVLYKKSNNTMFTHSRTCSGASQFYTRSGILQIKKNLSQTNTYYVDGDKVKRDLSIETDVCVLRRVYKSKRNKLSAQEALSAKSKYSTVIDTEIDTIEEFKPDNSASGDNQHIEGRSKQDDLATMMIENLKNLWNNWIQKNLIENKDTKQKIDTVLASLLHSLEKNIPDKSSSCSTYVLNKDGPRQVKNKKIETSITCQYCKFKPSPTIRKSSSYVLGSKDSSHHSVPFPYKNFKIISTLSIPRNFHKHKVPKTSHNNWYKVKKVNHKNILLSFNASSKVLESSSFDLTAISTKSLTKRRADYELHPRRQRCDRKRHIVFVPQHSIHKHKRVSDSNIADARKKVNREKVRDINMEELPSLVKTLYADHPANVTSSDKAVNIISTNDDCTMTEFANSQQISTSITQLCRDISCQRSAQFGVECNTNVNSADVLEECQQSEPLISIDFLNQSLEFTQTNTPDTASSYKQKQKISDQNVGIVKRRRMSGARKRYVHNRIPSITRYQNIKCRNFTYLYRKTRQQGCDFLKYCQNVFQYFAEYEGQRNIRLDIQINVNPMYEGEVKDKCTNMHENETALKESPTIIYTYNESDKDEEKPIELENSPVKSETQCQLECRPEIIPLLESAVSQSKYIFTNDTSTTKSDIVQNEKVNNIHSERSTITTDLDIVQELSELKEVIRDLAHTAEKYVAEYYKVPGLEGTISRHVCTSKKYPPITGSKPENTKAIQHSSNFSKTQKQSGLKLSKEPKKQDAFEFYSRLTKKSTSYNIIESESILKVTDMTSANVVNNSKLVDQALTCSLPKSRSLFEVANEGNKRKLIAFFCNNSCKPEISCSACSRLIGQPSGKKRKNRKPPKSNQKVCPAAQSSTPSCSSYLQLDQCPSFPYKLSSADIEAASDEDFKYQCRSRPGMGFGEGCMYCLLLWIPVIIIACLFYRYVLYEKISPGKKSTPWYTTTTRGGKPRVALQLADLGF